MILWVVTYIAQRELNVSEKHISSPPSRSKRKQARNQAQLAAGLALML
jgi:hypothetical protein